MLYVLQVASLDLQKLHNECASGQLHEHSCAINFSHRKYCNFNSVFLVSFTLENVLLYMKQDDDFISLGACGIKDEIL